MTEDRILWCSCMHRGVSETRFCKHSFRTSFHGVLFETPLTFYPSLFWREIFLVLPSFSLPPTQPPLSKCVPCPAPLPSSTTPPRFPVLVQTPRFPLPSALLPFRNSPDILRPPLPATIAKPPRTPSHSCFPSRPPGCKALKGRVPFLSFQGIPHSF